MSTTAAIQDVLTATVTALKTITTSAGYFTDPTVQTARYDPEEEHAETELAVRFDSWDRDPDSPDGFTEMLVHIQVGIGSRQPQSDSAEPMEWAMKAAADVEKALFADVTLGGKCQYLDIDGAENLDLEAESMSGLLLKFTAHVRYEIGNP